jgi:UDP-N-acetylglucosamine--N-acetylmuramyl-(pentapeptide) pyrophosphoryl-undecaprenol N-acetylglucosamine transferase
MNKHRLLIACGGTGGHVFPAVALAEGLRRRHPQTDVLFVGAFKPHLIQSLTDRGYQVNFMAGSAMPYRLNLLALPYLGKLFLSLCRAFGILKKWRPQVVVSMGSFSGGPFVLASKIFGLPVLIHEQNMVPGRANRISAYFADRIATSFDGTSRFFSKSARRKVVLTGNPVRGQITGIRRSQALAALDLSDGKFTILVMGGSQGSRRINEVFAEAAAGLDKGSFQIVHLTGKADFEFVMGRYRSIGIANSVMPFLDDMGRAYAACDLVICRSGATTIAEITLVGLASILIPYPYGDGHQKENARVLQEAGAALVMAERDLAPQDLIGAIKRLSSDKEALQHMRDNSRKLAMPDAAQRLTDEVYKIIDVS